MAQYRRAHGIKPPLTKEQKERLAFNQTYILEQQRRAHNKEIARRQRLKDEQQRRLNAR